MSSLIENIQNRLDLFSKSNREKLAQNIPLEFPSELANPFVEYMMERSYLEDIPKRDKFQIPDFVSSALGLVQICRLPIHPNDNSIYDLFSRWQSVLTALHAWNNRLIFILHRRDGMTSLYLGMQSDTIQNSISRLETALINCLPGISAKRVSMNAAMELAKNIQEYKSAGAITGIPSIRQSTSYSELQTLDSLAFGIKDAEGRDKDFAIVVVADPIQDGKIIDIISKYQELGTEIHKDVHKTYNKQEGTNRQKTSSFGLQALMGVLFQASPGIGSAVAYALGGGASSSQGKTISYSLSESTDFLNKFAENTEKTIDMHCERLRSGRNQGFWNAGVYVLSDYDTNVGTVLGMLRTIYSGDKSYIEPIRSHIFRHNSGALESIKSFSLIPLSDGAKDWHIFGREYEYISTPVNTQELSIFTSLPRKDVPGLRFVKSAVRFANNPGSDNGNNTLTLGRIKDYGIEQKSEYKLNLDALVRHSLIVGSTGSGKSTTCRRMIESVLDKGCPVLIIEPAKEEYFRWFLKMRKSGRNVNIFMPGVTSFEGERIEQLKLNPFQPAAVEGAEIDMMTRCEQLTALVNSSLPSSDVLPVIMDETFYTYLNDCLDGYSLGEMPQLKDYPKIEGAIETAHKVLKARGYANDVAQGIRAAVETRLTYLSRGKRGEVLNVLRSTDWKKLFDQTTVINLSRIANPKDRSLIMSIILLALHEYRSSKFLNDSNYRKDAEKNKLLHMTVVEEAHNVLSAPSIDSQGTGNPQQVVADLFSNMLSEIRAYGEGLMIVDQSPTKLIPDVIKNTNYKIAHRLTSKDDCIVMASALALREEQSGILPTLEIGDAIVYGDKDDAASWVKVYRNN